MLQIQIDHNSNLRYLPLVYFLPEDLISKCPTLRRLPRKVREVIYSEDMTEIVNSDQFLNEIMDASAALAFPYFGFGGWKEHYTEYSPVWRLSYVLPLWCKGLEKEIGWNLQALMYIPSSESIGFFEIGYITEVMARVVKRVVEEQDWQPILDVVREMPCDEDFEKWDTNVRKDFLRKWYHTRSKRVSMVSLEACIEDEDHGIHEIADTSSKFEDYVISEDYYRRFKEQLSAKDMTILELRVHGLTYEEIAKKLGYKNHSGVLKRMAAIKKEFLKYEEKSQH